MQSNFEVTDFEKIENSQPEFYDAFVVKQFRQILRKPFKLFLGLLPLLALNLTLFCGNVLTVLPLIIGVFACAIFSFLDKLVLYKTSKNNTELHYNHLYLRCISFVLAATLELFCIIDRITNFLKYRADITEIKFAFFILLVFGFITLFVSFISRICLKNALKNNYAKPSVFVLRAICFFVLAALIIGFLVFALCQYSSLNYVFNVMNIIDKTQYFGGVIMCVYCVFEAINSIALAKVSNKIKGN